jgi:hypothetical protein
MSPPLFEAHITYDIEHKSRVAALCPHGWKFSKIDGDPVMGTKVFCYLTSYRNDDQELLRAARAAVGMVGVLPLRLKIERIVYDSKIERNEIECT